MNIDSIKNGIVIDHIEAGRAELKIEDLVTLCRFYNVSADYMIGLINEPRPIKNKP